MDKSLFTESAEALLARARNAGYRVSEAQLARWHRIGLLPRPWQRSLGRKKGTKTLYPKGTGDQLIALCQIHFGSPGKKGGKRGRRLQFVGWRLWWLGFPVADKYSKPHLAKIQRSWSEVIPVFANSISSVAIGTHKPNELSERLGSTRKANPVFKQIRKRVRARKRDPKMIPLMQEIIQMEHYTAHAEEDFSTCIRILGEIVTGKFQGWSKKTDDKGISKIQEQQIIERAFGLHRARVNQWPAVGPMLKGDLGPVLVLLSHFFKEHPPTNLLDPIEVVAARDELRTLLNTLRTFGNAMQEVFGDHAYGLGTISDLAESEDINIQAVMIIVWTSLRNVSWIKEGVANIFAQLTQVQDIKNALAVTELIRKELPEFAEALSAEKIKGALQDRGKSLKAEMLRLSELYPDAVKAFQARHPELKTL